MSELPPRKVLATLRIFGGSLAVVRVSNTVLWARYGSPSAPPDAPAEGRLATHAFSIRDMDRFMRELSNAMGYTPADGPGGPSPLAASSKLREGHIVVWVDTLTKGKTRKREDKAADKIWGAFGRLAIPTEQAENLLRAFAAELGWEIDGGAQGE